MLKVQRKIIDRIQSDKLGKSKILYRLKDWAFPDKDIGASYP